MIWGCLKGKVKGNFKTEVRGTSNEGGEVGEVTQLGMDIAMTSGASSDGPRGTGVGRGRR